MKKYKIEEYSDGWINRYEFQGATPAREKMETAFNELAKEGFRPILIVPTYVSPDGDGRRFMVTYEKEIGVNWSW